MIKPEMIYTENPFVDFVVYYTKLMGLNAVVKNETEAMKFETSSSVKSSDLYIACREGRPSFDDLEYNREVLEKAGLSKKLVDACLRNKYNVPENKRESVRQLMMTYIIEHYNEENNYYRMLNGKPNIGDIGVKLSSNDLPNGVIIDTDKYIHELDEAQGNILIDYGIVDRIIYRLEQADINSTIDRKPIFNYNYLRYIGSNKIDIKIARQAYNYQLLYLPEIEFSELKDTFKETYLNNRSYTMRCVYSDAYRYGSDYYDNFIIIFIILQTMIDIISNVYEMIIRKDVFDSRSCRYLFMSYGIPYYPEIPLRYQIAMVKNVNTLLKYKSTSQNIIDICSIFGFDNVRVFKYYLLRDRKVDEDGNFIKAYKEIIDEDGNTQRVFDNEKMYDLKFIKVPIADKVDPYLKSIEDYIDYDPITLGDPYWDGDRDHLELKRAILDKEFAYVHSKYISIDSAYDLAQLSFEMPYFINMLIDNVYLEDLLTINIPYLSSLYDFKIGDVFIFLFALGYFYIGKQDVIIDTSTKVLKILGFNFKADMGELAAYLEDHQLTLELAGIADFTIPKSSILSFGQLMDIFTKNTKVFNHIREQMRKADNKRIYDIYKKLYDSLMIIELTNDYYKLPNGEVAKTYTEYLKYYNSTLYMWCTKVLNTTPVEDQRKLIADLIDNIVHTLDQYIDGGKFKYLYYFLPTVSVDSIKQYVYKVIDFFKSYKVTFLGINTVYVFDDKYDCKINILENWIFKSVYDKNEYYALIEDIVTHVDTCKKEEMKFVEKLFFDISTWGYVNFATINTYQDTIVDIVSTFLEKEFVRIIDTKYMNSSVTYKDVIRIITAMAIKASLDFKDVTHLPIDKFSEIWSIFTLTDINNDIDKIFLTSVIEKISNFIPQDRLNEYISTLIPKDELGVVEKILLQPFITIYKYIAEKGDPEEALSYLSYFIKSDHNLILDFKSLLAKVERKDKLEINEIVDIIRHHFFDSFPNLEIEEIMDYISNIGKSSINIIIDKFSKIDASYERGEYGVLGLEWYSTTSNIEPSTIYRPLDKIFIEATSNHV